jgi:predicted DsbA family dithiol-disulfide isomerase
MLNPLLADEGEDLMVHLTKKYGPGATKNFGDPNSYLMRAGRQVGVSFTNTRKIYPTLQAHALMEHVKEHENHKANFLMEEMYKNYFERGENINSVANLAEMAHKVGIDSEQVEAACSSVELKQRVRQKDSKHKTRDGISGVPFFIIHRLDGGRPLAFSGAQPPEMIAEQLQLASKDK